MRRSNVNDEEAETKKVGATGSGLIETERRSAICAITDCGLEIRNEDPLFGNLVAENGYLREIIGTSFRNFLKMADFAELVEPGSVRWHPTNMVTTQQAGFTR